MTWEKQADGDLEIIQTPEHMAWVNKHAFDEWKKLEGSVNTYEDFEKWLAGRGIALDTSSAKLKGDYYAKLMPKAVKAQADQIMAALCQYDELGGISHVNTIHLWTDFDGGQAQYHYRALGERRFATEGHIYFQNGATTIHQVMHEFAHAWSDSAKPRGEDVVTWSKKLNAMAGLTDASAYFGAASDVLDAEKFADAVATAFASTKGKHQSFVDAVADIKKGYSAHTKRPKVLKSEDKGGYIINTFSDGTYGYLMPDGTFKNGYKSKDGAGKMAKKLAAGASKKAQEDAQAKLLEKQAQELQQKLQLTYADAVDGMTARIEKSLKQFTKDNAQWQADVAAGKKDAKAYAAWCKDQALHNDRLKALKKALTQDLTATDKMAMAYVNQVPAGVYAEGMNFATYEIEHGAKANTSFTLYNKTTVMELVANEPDLLPQAAFDKAKDTAWNSRHVTTAVTQAVLQGQTVPQLAASIAGIAAMDQRAAMKAARTAITSAHSLGKLKGYERAAGMGIGVKKQWLAALDSRTRGSHRHLDGETVGLDEEFSNGLKYPGDPDGPGSEVYNCRCTLVPVVDGIEYDEVERANKLGKMSYGEWKNEHLAASGAGAKAKDLATRRQEIADARAALAKEIEKATDLAEKADMKATDASLALQEEAVGAQMQEQGLVADSPYSDERKANAWQNMQDYAWDEKLRASTGEVWRAATAAERSAAYTYTTNAYTRFNEPLSGFMRDNLSQKYVGPKKVDLNDQGSKSKIKALTSLLEKSSYDHDMWVTRGASAAELMNVFNLTVEDLDKIADGKGDDYIGVSGRSMAFMSTSPIYSSFYRDADVKMNIYVPAGSEMIYAEPFSHYNKSKYNGKKWDGKEGTAMFGDEFETILQRGGSYTITGVRYSSDYDAYYVDMELHPEAGYDKFEKVEK